MARESRASSPNPWQGTNGSVAGSIVDDGNLELYYNSSTPVTVANDISGTGGILADETAQITVLSGHDTYSGTTQVMFGTLRGGVADAFGTGSAVSIAQGAALDLGGHDQHIGSLADLVNSDLSGFPPQVVGNSGTAPATLYAGADNTSTSFSGKIADGAPPNNGGLYAAALDVAGTLSGTLLTNAGTANLSGTTQVRTFDNTGTTTLSGTLDAATIDNTGGGTAYAKTPDFAVVDTYNASSQPVEEDV